MKASEAKQTADRYPDIFNKKQLEDFLYKINTFATQGYYETTFTSRELNEINIKALEELGYNILPPNESGSILYGLVKWR